MGCEAWKMKRKKSLMRNSTTDGDKNMDEYLLPKNLTRAGKTDENLPTKTLQNCQKAESINC